MHLELMMELLPDLELSSGLKLAAEVADWLLPAIVEAILKFENDVLD